MARPKKAIRDFRLEIVSAAEASKFLGLPERSFYRLVEAGVIPRLQEGEYPLGEVVEAYWKSLFDAEGLTAARTRLTSAQAEMAELELSEVKGELHRASAIVHVWGETISNAKAKILAIPTKVSPELVGKNVTQIQDRLKEEIYEVLNELAEYNSGRIARASTSSG